MKTEKNIAMEREYDLLATRTANAIRQAALAACNLGRLCAMMVRELWRACAGGARNAKRTSDAFFAIEEREILKRYENGYRKDAGNGYREDEGNEYRKDEEI